MHVLAQSPQYRPGRHFFAGDCIFMFRRNHFCIFPIELWCRSLPCSYRVQVAASCVTRNLCDRLRRSQSTKEP
jgi:hypothetical protein